MIQWRPKLRLRHAALPAVASAMIMLIIAVPAAASFRLPGGTFGSLVLSVVGDAQVLTGQVNNVRGSSVISSTPIPQDFNGAGSFTAPLYINFNSAVTQLVLLNADAGSLTQVNIVFRNGGGNDLGCASVSLPAGGATLIDLKNFLVDTCP